MASAARRYSVSNPPPTSGNLQGRETQQEAEVLELLAAQASRDGDESKAIQMMERALQIRCQVTAALGEKASQYHDAAAAVSSTATSPTGSVVAQRQRQEAAAAAAAASESNEQYLAAANELYDAADRLVARCNVYAVQSFKKGDYDAAEGLLAYCLQLTEEDAYPLCDVPERRQHLRGTTFNNYGSLERNRGHFREALQYFQTSMAVTGTESPIAYMNMSAVLVQLRQCDEAAEAAARAVSLLSHAPEDPSLLAVAHHNYAMALEPVDPARSLEEYTTAYQTASATMGPQSAATQSILQNWERFQRHHPHLAGGHTIHTIHNNNGLGSGTTTPRIPSPHHGLNQRTPTPPQSLAQGRRASKSPSLATSAAAMGGAGFGNTQYATSPTAASTTAAGAATAAVASNRRSAADPTAADLAEIFPHPFMASASMPKPAQAPSATPMYRPTMSGPRRPLVPPTQPRMQASTTSSTGSARPPPMRQQRSPAQPNTTTNFAATMQPTRQKPAKSGAASTHDPSTRPTRPATATTRGQARNGTDDVPAGHYVVGGSGSNSGRHNNNSSKSTGRLSPVRPVTSGRAEGKSAARTASRGGQQQSLAGKAGGAGNGTLLRPGRQPEKRLSAVGRNALPPLSAGDADDHDGASSSASGKRRSTRSGKRSQSSTGSGPSGSSSPAAGGGDLQSFMNDRLEMLLHDEEEFERKYDKAVAIQRIYRGHRARAQARDLRDGQAREARLLELRRAMAARTIQRAYRQAQYGLYAATVRRLMGQPTRKDRGQWGPDALAATEIQRMARGWLARREVRRRRAYEANADPAALRVQTWYRGKLAQRELARLRAEQIALRRGFYGEQYDYAATRIQSQWRRRQQYQLARAELDGRRLQRLRERQQQQTEAAMRVQRGWRCACARREAAQLRADRDAREAQRRAYEEQRKAAIRIQSFGRMIIVKQRGYPGLDEARLRAAHKVRYARQNWAARTIQCAYRRHAAQAELQRRRAASTGRRLGSFAEVVVRRLQRVGRAYMERVALSNVGEALAAEALRYIRGVARLREEDAREAEHAEAMRRHHSEQRAIVRAFGEDEEVNRMELELCEHRYRTQLLERATENRPAGPVTTSHTRVFPEDDWEPAMRRFPDLLHMAFVDDLVDACELASPAQVRDVHMVLGSLCVSYAIEHSSAISPLWFDAKAGYGAFPTLHALRVRACQEDEAERALALAELEAEAAVAAAAIQAEEAALAAALEVAALVLEAQEAVNNDDATHDPNDTGDVHVDADDVDEEEAAEDVVVENASAPRAAVADEAEPDTAVEASATPKDDQEEEPEREAQSIDVPMTLEEALAIERAKRQSAKAEELRLEQQREEREQAKQAFRQQRIADASTESDLAPYLPGMHVVSHGPLSKATFQQSMRPSTAHEASAAAKEVAAHRASESDAAQAAAEATAQRREAAATTISRAYRGHRARLYRRTLADLQDELDTHRTEYEYRRSNPYVEYDQLRRHLGARAGLPSDVTAARQTSKTATETKRRTPTPPPPHSTITATTTTQYTRATPPPRVDTAEPTADVTREPMEDLVNEGEATTCDNGMRAIPHEAQEVLGGFVKVVAAKRERQLRLAAVQELMAAAMTPAPTPKTAKTRSSAAAAAAASSTTSSTRPAKPRSALAVEHKLGDSNRALLGVVTPANSSTTSLVHAHAAGRSPVPVSMSSTPKYPASTKTNVAEEANIGAEASQHSGHFALASLMNSSPKYPTEATVVAGPEGNLGAEKSQTSQASAQLALASLMNSSPKYPTEATRARGAEAPLGAADVSRTSHLGTSQASAHFALASLMQSSPKYPVQPELAVGREDTLGAEISRTSRGAGASQASAQLAPVSAMHSSVKYPVVAHVIATSEAPLGAEVSRTSDTGASQTSVRLAPATTMHAEVQQPTCPELAIGAEGYMGAETSQTSHLGVSQASAHLALAPVMQVSPTSPARAARVVGPEGALGAEISRTSHLGASQASAQLQLAAMMQSSPKYPATAEVIAPREAPLGHEAAAQQSHSSAALAVPTAVSIGESSHLSHPSTTADAATAGDADDAEAVAARDQLDALEEDEETLAVEALLSHAATEIQRLYRGHHGRRVASAARAQREAYLAERMARALAEEESEEEEDYSEQYSEPPTLEDEDLAAYAQDSSSTPVHPHDTLPYDHAVTPLNAHNANPQDDDEEDEGALGSRPDSRLSELSGPAAPEPHSASAPSRELEQPRFSISRQMMTYPSEDAVVREVQPGEPDLTNSKSWEEDE